MTPVTFPSINLPCPKDRDLVVKSTNGNYDRSSSGRSDQIHGFEGVVRRFGPFGRSFEKTMVYPQCVDHKKVGVRMELLFTIQDNPSMCIR